VDEERMCLTGCQNPDHEPHNFVNSEVRLGDHMEPRPPITIPDEEKVTEHKTLTPEEMAEQMGVAVSEVGEAMMAQMKLYGDMMKSLADRMNPPKPNRAQRRAMAHGHSQLHGQRRGKR
jgi:hypothetical protein